MAAAEEVWQVADWTLLTTMPKKRNRFMPKKEEEEEKKPMKKRNKKTRTWKLVRGEEKKRGGSRITHTYKLYLPMLALPGPFIC